MQEIKAKKGEDVDTPFHVYILTFFIVFAIGYLILEGMDNDIMEYMTEKCVHEDFGTPTFTTCNELWWTKGSDCDYNTTGFKCLLQNGSYKKYEIQSG